MSTGLMIIIILAAIWLINCVKILREYERGVVFRLGRALKKAKGPGIILILWPIDKMVCVQLRIITLDVPPQDVITKDNVSIKVNAVVYYRVMDPMNAIIEVEDYSFATSQLCQTTLRSVLGEVELDTLLAERETINRKLQDIIDTGTDPWGIKVSNVEVKHVDLPEEMRRAMAKQAEAERERRAKIIHAEGEFQAAEKLMQAAKVLSEEPISMQMRYLQTLSDIATENNSTIVFPLPMDLIKPLLEKLKK